MFVLTVVLSLVLAAVFAVSAVFKVVKNPTGTDMAYDLKWPIGLFRAVGWLELLGAVGLVVGLWIPRVGVYAALLLAVLMAITLLSRLRVRAALMRFATPLALGALAVIALLLRAETA